MTATGAIEGGTADRDEVARFAAAADRWWDADGPFAPLHRLNPVRLGYVRDRLCARFGRDPRALAPLAGLRVLDVGCGGGLAAEPLARMGASVTAIDAAPENVAAARAHADGEGVEIDYRAAAAEDLAREGARFDAVLALEVVEHAADPGLFLDCCCALVDDGGALVLATLNRTPKAFLLGVVAAEHVLRWLPRGTHDWRRFARPSEIARAMRRNGMAAADVTGLAFDLAAREWRLSEDVSVNYMLLAEKPGRP